MIFHRKTTAALTAAVVLVLPSAIPAPTASAAPVCSPGTTVTTDDGPACGVAGTEVGSWPSIRYAAPPAGDLRREPPRRPAPWTGPFPATTEGNQCPRPAGTGPGSADEDCLNPTVRVPAKRGPGPLAVMVQIHGGGFPLWKPQDASHLTAAGNVIGVEVNYRLGIFGFLAHEAFGGLVGDCGLQDQQAALRSRLRCRGGVPAGLPQFFVDPSAPNGAYHIAEWLLLLPEGTKLIPDQRVLSGQLVARWTGFARTGNPTVDGTPRWEPYTPDNPDNPVVMSLDAAGDSPLTTQIPLSSSATACGTAWARAPNVLPRRKSEEAFTGHLVNRAAPGSRPRARVRVVVHQRSCESPSAAASPVRPALRRNAGPYSGSVARAWCSAATASRVSSTGTSSRSGRRAWSASTTGASIPEPSSRHPAAWRDTASSP